jgi:hypothetical protein
MGYSAGENLEYQIHREKITERKYLMKLADCYNELEQIAR